VDDRRESLLKEYSEVSSNFRMLTDIRFKLLGLVPVATVVTALTTAAKGELLAATTFVLALFGLMVVLGLITYSVRNDQLYDELVGRAAEIERSLGIRDGSYGFRPRAWLHLSLGPLGWSLNHGNALLLIYGATVAIWLTGVIAPLLEAVRWAYVVHLAQPPLLQVPDVQAAVVLLAFAIATLVTVLLGLWAQCRRHAAAKRLHVIARKALRHALRRRLDAAWEAAKDDRFIELCTLLAGKKPSIKDQARMRRRAAFHTAPENSAKYLPQQSDSQFAAHLIAALSDLTPRYILDSETGRRSGTQPADRRVCCPSHRQRYRAGRVGRLSMPRSPTR
jgi:hypothetical protein